MHKIKTSHATTLILGSLDLYFTPNNLLYYYLALKLTLEYDLDGLENGASENHVIIIQVVNK